MTTRDGRVGRRPVPDISFGHREEPTRASTASEGHHEAVPGSVRRVAGTDRRCMGSTFARGCDMNGGNFADGSLTAAGAE